MRIHLPDTTETPWRRLLLVAAGAFVLLASVVTYALIAGHHETPEGASASASPRAPEQPPPKPSSLRSNGPEDFVREVAAVLFTWDTRAMATPTHVAELLVQVGDPTGESSAGLVADITNYLPTGQIWLELRKYETRQWLEISSVEVPDLWSTAEDQAGSDLLPGTSAFTVRGIRHREGVWEGAAVSSQHGVTFTVFVVCGPTYPECHLLRLSRLDDPLE